MINLNRYRRGKLLRLMVAQSGRCFYCHELMLEPTQDHFVPKTKGGMGRINNLVLACRGCNQEKSGRNPTPAEQRRRIALARRASQLSRQRLKKIDTILGHIEAARRKAA